jgi:hypothetical protein
MNDWHTLSLGDGITAAIPAGEIEALFRQHFHAAGSPPQMAVFTRSESEGRLHCEVIAYFSPACSELAHALDAQECDMPTRTGLQLLAGDERAWAALFPTGEL